MSHNISPVAKPLFTQFASDNYAGICPEAWLAMEESNQGFVSSYGDDYWTERACESIRRLIGTDCQIFFVFNGTAANSLALASLCRSYNSVICHDMAHIETDECGAPEFFSNGTKIMHTKGANGKLNLKEVEFVITRRTDIHYPKPRALSITQSTELGTVYTPDEIRAACDLAHKHGLRVHMDGARLANAVASLGLSPAEITWKCGVDVLCLGGAKNGTAIGEAVVFFDSSLAEEFDYRCKQAGQLASKMRFISAPWTGVLDSGAWLRNAEHANSKARLLADSLSAIPGVSLTCPCQANAVFAEMPDKATTALHEAGWHFYSFIGPGTARFMCSWLTSDEDVHALSAAVRAAVSKHD